MHIGIITETSTTWKGSIYLWRRVLNSQNLLKYILIKENFLRVKPLKTTKTC